MEGDLATPYNIRGFQRTKYIHVYLKNEVRLSIIQWGLLGHAKSQGFRFDTHLLMSYVIIFHSKICFELVICIHQI